MYSERWLFLSMVLYLLTSLMTVSCEYQNIGCYDATLVDNSGTIGSTAGFLPNIDDCIAKCETYHPAPDMILNWVGSCYCSTTFEPGQWSQLSDCTPHFSKISVTAKLIADCSDFPNCGTCTARHCVTCDTTSEFNDAVECESSGDACTTSPCGDVCIVDDSTPDGFICSCSDDSHFLDDNNNCQECNTILPNCLQCSSSTECTKCSGIFVVNENGNCEAQSPPDNLVASINGDPHVLIKNGDAADPSQYFCFDIVALPDHQYVTILQDSTLNLQIHGDLIPCGDGMSCLSEITIVHEGTTLTFYDNDNIEFNDNPLYTWETITELVTVGTITIEPNDPGRQKTVSINIGDHLLYYNVHFLQLSSFSYLGIMFLNDHYSQDVTGAIGKFLGEEFSTLLTVGTNEGTLTFDDPTVEGPLSVRRTSRYNPHTQRTVQCDFHENPEDELVAGFLHANNPTA